MRQFNIYIGLLRVFKAKEHTFAEGDFVSLLRRLRDEKGRSKLIRMLAQARRLPQSSRQILKN